MSTLSALRERCCALLHPKNIALVVPLVFVGIVQAGPVQVVPPGAMNQGLPMGTPLQILWTNDTHGFFLPVYHAEYNEVDTYAQTAATEGKVGGYAQISGLVKTLRQGIWSQNTLFMDAGDTIDGSPVAQKTRGQAVIPVLNAMGYDAWTPGNRDFAWPKADFLAAVGQMKFPVVCSNLIDTSTGQYAFPRFLIKQVGGLKVAILGLTSMVGAGTTSSYVLDGIVGSPVTPAAPNATAALETSVTNLVNSVRAAENPDVVIVLSHLGFYIDQKLARNTTGIDVIVGAHTHHNVKTAPVIQNKDGSRNVIVTQAGSHGKYLGRLQLWVSGGKVLHFGNDLIRVSEASLAEQHAQPDAAVADLANAAYAPFQTMFDEVIGRTDTVLERRGDTQSTMTNFLTDALADRFGAQLGWFPGIRYGSSLVPGPITVGDVWNIVSPNFSSLTGQVSDALYTQTISGAALAAQIQNALATEYSPDPYLFSGGDVARFSGRLKYTYLVNSQITLLNGTKTRLQNLQYVKPDNTTINIVVNGVLQPGMATTPFTMASTFLIPQGVANQVRATGTNADGTVRNLSAVDEIVTYIRNKGTIAPVLDNRTVQADTGASNVATIDSGTPSNVVLAPGLAIAAGNEAASGTVPDVATLPDFVDFVY